MPEVITGAGEIRRVSFRTPYDPDSLIVDRDDRDFGDEPSLTVQAQKDECDINIIIDRANRGMAIPENRSEPRFGDFSDFPDYQTSLNRVIEAQKAFDALPAKVRDRFHNDPAKLLSFLNDDGNRAEAVNLGLLDAPAPVDPAPPVSADPAGGVGA